MTVVNWIKISGLLAAGILLGIILTHPSRADDGTGIVGAGNFQGLHPG